MSSSSGGETHSNNAIRTAAVAGGAAGDHTVTGIKEEDALKSVLHFQGDGTQLTGVEDLTSEFSITGDDTINNATGTDTTNGFLVVIYIEAHARGDDLNRN